MREFVLFSIAVLSVFSFAESTEVLPFTEEESRYVQNLNGEDEVEVKANWRRKLELVLDPRCADTVEGCLKENGGRLDCHESCDQSLNAVPVPEVSHDPYEAVNTCIKPHQGAVRVHRRPTRLDTANFAQLGAFKKVTDRGNDVDFGERVDRLIIGEHPEFQCTCSFRCVDEITRVREEPAVSKCKVVNVPSCEGDVAETFRRRHPECFKGGCNTKMLTKEVAADDCFQVCRSWVRCLDVRSPRCIKIVRGSKMSSQDAIDDCVEALTTSNRDLLLRGNVGSLVHHCHPRISRSARGFKWNNAAPYRYRYRYPWIYYSSGAPQVSSHYDLLLLVVLLLR